MITGDQFKSARYSRRDGVRGGGEGGYSDIFYLNLPGTPGGVGCGGGVTLIFSICI